MKIKDELEATRIALDVLDRKAVAMQRVINAADKLLDWRGTEGFNIIDPNLREYVDACKALHGVVGARTEEIVGAGTSGV